MIEKDARKIRNHAKRVPTTTNMSIQKIRNIDAKRSPKLAYTTYILYSIEAYIAIPGNISETAIQHISDI